MSAEGSAEPVALGDHQTSWRPEILDLGSAEGRARLAALGRDGIVFSRHDTIDEQLRDLVACRHPAEDPDRAALERHVAAHLGGRSSAEHGRWIHYPWSGRLVHLLPEDEFRELRSNRNRDKITADEQRRLRQGRIGVVGLSVGQASALTLALEGVGGAFRLADFDTLALSNLNRLRAGTHELGLNKAVLAARQMFEIDPYLDIEIFPAGLDEASIERFMGDGAGRIDVLVEECDDFFVKVLARHEARRRQIPVVMDTNDRGLLDIERFDLEPTRPLFHGLAGELDPERLRGLSMKEKLPYVMRIIDETAISPRLARSMPEIKRTLCTWPQLASGVALGGALVAHAVRRILLGQMSASGRFYVDIEAIVADPPPAAAPAA
ncbi:MAG TPA: Rv1355c family protein [Stellaceae bacterium]